MQRWWKLIADTVSRNKVIEKVAEILFSIPMGTNYAPLVADLFLF